MVTTSVPSSASLISFSLCFSFWVNQHLSPSSCYSFDLLSQCHVPSLQSFIVLPNFHDSSCTRKTSSLPCFETASSDILLSRLDMAQILIEFYIIFCLCLHFTAFSLASVLDYSYGSSTNNVLLHL